MYDIATFELPKWIERFRVTTKYDLSGSSAPPLSGDDLIALSNDPETTRRNISGLQSMKLAYGVQEGSIEARQNLAAMINLPNGAKFDVDNLILTNGSSSANQVILESLISPGMGVVAVYPTYGQLLEVPKAAGADMSYWTLNPNNGWQLDMAELEKLVQPGKTKVIILNNPSNPTGSYITNDLQQKIVELARKHDITIFSDEVFRPLFVDCPDNPKSILEWGYDNTIISSSMSKCWGMPGARVGWLASNSKALLKKCTTLRDYSNTFTTPLVEVLVAEAVSERCRDKIVGKNKEICRKSIAVIEQFVKRNKGVVHWTKPVAAATTLIQFTKKDSGLPVDDVEFCARLQSTAGVLFAPASLCFGSTRGAPEGTDFNGFVRCTLIKDCEFVKAGLDAVQAFLDSGEYDKIPAAANGMSMNGVAVNGNS